MHLIEMGNHFKDWEIRKTHFEPIFEILTFLVHVCAIKLTFFFFFISKIAWDTEAYSPLKIIKN